MKQHEILQHSWIWNDTVSEYVKLWIRDGKSINICAGQSEIGDVKIDLDPKTPDIQKADMNNLPFPDCSFDYVIEDPPWKIGFYQRMRPFFECVRICRVGGLIIYNAYWIPESKAVEKVAVVVRQDKAWTNTSIITVFRKVTAEHDHS
jgi:ubiquinone/menaquinone biosynthesis C-methylase UbiE